MCRASELPTLLRPEPQRPKPQCPTGSTSATGSKRWTIGSCSADHSYGLLRTNPSFTSPSTWQTSHVIKVSVPLTTLKVEDGVQYKKMYPPLQQATALLLLHEDPNLLFTAFHTIVRHLRCIFPGHIPHSQIIPDDDSPHAIFSPLRRITGHHIHASHQAYAAYLQYIPWTGTPDFLARRISSLRTLQSLLNDLGWYHVYQLDFVDARTLGGAAHHITTHDPVREWIVQNPDMATAPFPEAVFHLELDSLVLCTWAWIWCSLEQQSVGDLDTWFKMELPPSVVNNVKYMQGYWRAVEYWGQVVDKVGAWLDKADEEGGGGEKGGSGGEGDGGGEGERDGGGEGERRKRVVERLEGLYGNGRRMAIFWQFEESFDWKLQWKEKTEEKEKAEEKVKVKAKAKAE